MPVGLPRLTVRPEVSECSRMPDELAPGEQGDQAVAALVRDGDGVARRAAIRGAGTTATSATRGRDDHQPLLGGGLGAEDAVPQIAELGAVHGAGGSLRC